MRKKTFRIIMALIISLSLAGMCLVYIPFFFNNIIETGFEMLPKNKVVEKSIQRKSEFSNQWGIDLVNGVQKEELRELRRSLPHTRDKSTFFADMFVTHDYPEKCQFVLVGAHKTLDVTWQIQGLKCDGPKSCKLAKEEQICPDKHGR